VGLGGVGDVEVPVLAEVLEGHVVGYEIVADALLAGGGNGEGRERGVELAVTGVAGVVVVDKVVVTLDAVGVDGTLERLKIVGDGRDTGLSDIAAVDVASAAVTILVVVV